MKELRTIHTPASFVRCVVSVAKATGHPINLFAPGKYAEMMRLQDRSLSPAQAAYALRTVKTQPSDPPTP